MGKLTTFIFVFGGLLLLFYFTGLLQECEDDGMCMSVTPNSKMLDLLMHPENMQNSDFSLTALLVLSGTLVGAIAIGILTGRPELALLAPIGIFLMGLLWDFLYVFNRVRAENPVFAVLFFAPVMIMFVITIMDWWRGRDT